MLSQTSAPQLDTHSPALRYALTYHFILYQRMHLLHCAHLLSTGYYAYLTYEGLYIHVCVYYYYVRTCIFHHLLLKLHMLDIARCIHFIKISHVVFIFSHLYIHFTVIYELADTSLYLTTSANLCFTGVAPLTAMTM